MKKTLFLLGEILEDFFIFAGLLLLVITTYSLNVIAGNYFLGLILVVLGVFLAKRR